MRALRRSNAAGDLNQDPGSRHSQLETGLDGFRILRNDRAVAVAVAVADNVNVNVNANVDGPDV